MNLDDPDDLRTKELTRRQYNAMILEQTHGPTTHDSICSDAQSGAAPEASELPSGKLSMESLVLSAAYDKTISGEEAIEQLKALGVPF